MLFFFLSSWIYSSKSTSSPYCSVNAYLITFLLSLGEKLSWLAKNAGEENVQDMLIALDFVAHYIHFNKKYPLAEEDFVKVIEEYGKAYDNELNPMFVYNMAIKSNIIREVKGKEGIEFCDENLLAYFTAAHLNRKFNEGKVILASNTLLNTLVSFCVFV